MKKLKLVVPSMGLIVGNIYEASVNNNNMCHIIINDEHKWVNRNKFVLIADKMNGRNNFFNKYNIKKNHNKQTRLNAENHLNPWDDKNIEEIFLTDIDYTEFPNKEIDDFCEKFKRTYFAIEAISRVKYEYLKTGKIRDFYYNYQKDILGKNGVQFKKILDKLIQEKKI